MAAERLAGRSFSLSDQLAFARLSGDANPIHVDPVAARRSLAGAPLVHGVHLLLWGLEALAAHAPFPRPLTGLRVNFEKMVPVDTPVEAVLADRKDDRARIEIRIDGRPAAVILAAFAAKPAERPAFTHARRFDAAEPLALPLAEMATLSGHVAAFGDSEGLAQAFPALAAEIGVSKLTGLADATYIVGMVCPGLHSIFRSLDLAAAQDGDRLNFEIASLDERFRMLRIAVSGSGWAGRLDAHIRPEPVAQPDMAEIAARVQPGAFEGARALIVGGSRGLGETLAKVLAAGGAEVAITYRIGEADAARVAQDIAAMGGRCRVLRYDAVSGDPAMLGKGGFSPNQIYYMATPAIRPGPGGFSPTRFADYTAFYLDGFARLVDALAPGVTDGLSLFYPSTVYVEDAPSGFAEYAMAKAAGEILCRDYVVRGLARKALVERLPRLLTDQTRSLADEEFPDAVERLIAIATAMNA